MEMTRDEVSCIAAQCGIRFAPMPCGGAEDPLIGACNFNEFVRFADLVAKAEREACAKVCEDYEEHIETLRDGEYQAELAGRQAGAARCAVAIRARGGE